MGAILRRYATGLQHHNILRATPANVLDMIYEANNSKIIKTKVDLNFNCFSRE